MNSISTQTLPAGLWAVDGVHSHVGFAVDYMASTFLGWFADVDATLQDGALTGAVGIGNVQVQDAHLEACLQAPDFFDAERHPYLTFESSRVALERQRLAIDGEITIKGHTESIAIAGHFTQPILDPFGDTRLGLELHTKIDRTKFGVSWNNPLPDGTPALSDVVTISVHLQFVKRG